MTLSRHNRASNELIARCGRRFARKPRYFEGADIVRRRFLEKGRRKDVSEKRAHVPLSAYLLLHLVLNGLRGVERVFCSDTALTILFRAIGMPSEVHRQSRGVPKPLSPGRNQVSLYLTSMLSLSKPDAVIAALMSTNTKRNFSLKGYTMPHNTSGCVAILADSYGDRHDVIFWNGYRSVYAA